VAALVVASAKLVGAFVVVVVVVGALVVVVVVDALVVVVAVTFTQAHLSAGSGRPKSYQCKYPGLHVQQLRVGVAVLSAALVAARVVGALVVVVVGALVVVVVGALVVVVVVGAFVVVVGALVVGALVVVVGALVVVVVGALVVPVGMEEAATTPATGMYPFSMLTMFTPC